MEIPHAPLLRLPGATQVLRFPKMAVRTAGPWMLRVHFFASSICGNSQDAGSIAEEVCAIHARTAGGQAAPGGGQHFLELLISWKPSLPLLLPG